MNLDTLRANLKQTIAGKKKYLAEKNAELNSEDAHARMVAYVVVKLVEVNVEELERILTDVELCINHAAANSWAGSVDRMSGAFDESELRGRDGWL